MEFVVKFFTELLKRLMAETPWFFKVIRTIGIVAALITGVPALLESSGVVLPEALHILANKIVSIAAMVSVFVAQLTVTTEAKKENNIN